MAVNFQPTKKKVLKSQLIIQKFSILTKKLNKVCIKVQNKEL